MEGPVVVASSPGRVNLIGDHTDYTGGLVLPMAIDRRTEIHATLGGDAIEIASEAESRAAHIPLPASDPVAIEPPWARFAAAVAHVLGTSRGFRGRITSDLPIGAGLSSSAALEVALSFVMRAEMDPRERALACQKAEKLATGVPCGIMDQLTVIAGRAGHALVIDCHDLSIEEVRVPDEAAVFVRFVAPRRLATSAYAERVARCAEAETHVGPLRRAERVAVERIADREVRARARHVVSENERVRRAAAALRAGDLATMGALMLESHESLKRDFECSTDQMDAEVERLSRVDGVHGARMTGGGFGGSVVVLADSGLDESTLGDDFIRVRPSDGAGLRLIEA